MKGINTEQVIKKYKQAGRLYRLHGGGQVVGQEVDAENRLVYVIREDDGSMRLSHASDEQPELTIVPTTPHKITVTIGTPSVDKNSLE